MIVEEAYRRQGVGERLMGKLFEALQPIEVVSLFCQQKFDSVLRDERFSANLASGDASEPAGGIIGWCG